MQQAPIPQNETKRLEALRKLDILDTPTEERFDRITRLAVKVFHVPISTITLVDENREWFKSVCGLNQREGDRAISFCGHALLSNDIFIIQDTKKDPRFSDNPMVVGKPFIRFYAGVPLFSAGGERIGSFCIKGLKPREVSEEEKEILKGFTKWAEIEINAHNLSMALDKIKQSTLELDAFFTLSQDLLGIASTRGFLTRVNPSFQRILGYSDEEFLAGPFLDFVHPDDVVASMEEVKKLSKGQETINFINRFRNKDGGYVWIEWNASSSGQQIFACGRDITRSREELTELKQLNKAMVDRELKMIELKGEINRLKKLINDPSGAEEQGKK